MYANVDSEAKCLSKINGFSDINKSYPFSSLYPENRPQKIFI